MSSSMPSWEELKRRKLVQWAVAYLAGAWVALQLLDVVAEPWGIGSGLLLAAQIVLAFGFLATLVLAWYHGEQGRQRVSGPELLMLAALLVIAGAAITFVRGDGEVGTAQSGDDASHQAPGIESPVQPFARDSIPFRSVAVLPLDDNSPSPEHAYFADAMTEQITHALSQIPDLFVPSRNSAAEYPESDQSLREFARALGVSHVIEGSVQRVEEDVRIVIQLVDARTLEHVWSRTYDRQLTDVLRLQTEIAREIADQLASSFTSRQEERILAGSTDDPVAYDLYLRAWDADELDETIELLRRAIDRDPGFGLAWGDLGGTFFYWKRLEEREDLWTDSIVFYSDSAIALIDDPALDLYYRALKTWSLARSRQELRRAIGLLEEAVAVNPTAGLLGQLELAYRWHGDLDEAYRVNERLRRLNPLDPGVWASRAWLYTLLGMDEQAEQAIAVRRSMEPDQPGAWLDLSSLRRLQGDYDEALAFVDSAVARGHQWGPARRGNIQMAAGKLESGLAAFAEVEDRLSAENDWADAPVTFTQVLLLRGDTPAARALQVELEVSADLTPTDADTKYRELALSALFEEMPAVRNSMQEYVADGGRWARLIRREPEFARVRSDSVFRAELTRLEEIVERQRRQVERQLSEEQ